MTFLVFVVGFDDLCIFLFSVWQHSKCMGVNLKKLPKVYMCEACDPRPLKWNSEQVCCTEHVLNEFAGYESLTAFSFSPGRIDCSLCLFV